MARAAALRRAFAFAAMALLLVAAPASADDGSDVITLTSKNFDAVVNKEKIIVRARATATRRGAPAPLPRGSARVASRSRRPLQR